MIGHGGGGILSLVNGAALPGLALACAAGAMNENGRKLELLADFRGIIRALFVGVRICG